MTPGTPATRTALRRPTRPTVEQLLDGVLALARELHLDTDTPGLAARFLATLSTLFPGRAIALRLVDAQGAVHAFTAPGGPTLLPAASVRPLRVKRSAAEKTRLRPEELDGGLIELVDAPPAVFEGTTQGFTAALVAHGGFFGCLDVAYPDGAPDDGTPDPALAEADERDILPIANQLSVALRNVRLHGESEVLKDTLAKLVDHADALILSVDRNLKVTVVNQALVRLTGIVRGDVVGADVARFLPKDDRVRLLETLNDALAGRATRTTAVSLPTASGGHVHTVWNVAGVSNGREIEGVVGVGQDVTRLRSLEEQIVHAEKLATLGQIAAGVAHELNNPLTSVVVYADYLVKKAEKGVVLEEADIERLRRVLTGAERIQNFARELVQYARPSKAKPEPLSLNEVVRQAMSFCEHLLANAGHEVTLDLGADLPALRGVRADLQQVVINLISNAVAAIGEAHTAPPGEGRSPLIEGRKGHLRLRTFEKSARHLALLVEDDAGTLPAALKEKIFEPFFTTKVDGKGAGLGLSIVRNIVEQHHGSIVVEAQHGVRTAFTVVLPRD